MATGSILAEHFRRNSTTRGRWDAMTLHRTRVMELLTRARGESGKSICILGPGNGNDIELANLVDNFEQISLVDLDCEAVSRAISRLNENEKHRVRCHCPVELTGVLSELESWRARSHRTDEEISAVKRAAMATLPPSIGTFDVVASTCVLTQLIDAVYMSLPEKHRRRDELLRAVRNRHLEMILEMLNPVGVGVLVTDFVVANPAQPLAPLGKLTLSMSTQVEMKQREFFTGTDPFEIRDYYQRLVGPGPTTQEVAIEGPWTWEVGGRLLGVCAVVIRRQGGEALDELVDSRRC